MNRIPQSRALAALLVLGLLVVPAPAPAQEVVASPLVVTDIEFPFGQPYYFSTDPHDGESWIGESRDVSVTVSNQGSRNSAAYQVTFYWEAPDGDRVPLNGQEAYSFDDGEALEPGQQRTHTIEWGLFQPQGEVDAETIPALGPGKVVVEVDEFTTTSGSVDAFVAVYDYHITSPTEHQEALAPDETIRIPIPVQTYSNVDETLTWTVTQSHPRLDAALDAVTTEHPVGEDGQNVLSVSYPFDGVVEDEDDLVVEVSAVNEIGVPRYAATLPIDLRHERTTPTPGIDLQGPAEAVHAPPGEATAVSFVLTNTGDASDAYDLTREVGGGWNASPIKDGTVVTDRVRLGPDESKTLTVEVQPPAGAATLTQLALTAVSDGGLSATATAPLLISGPRPSITGLTITDATGAPVYQDDPLNVRVTYVNTGDQKLTGATLTTTLDYADGTRQTDNVGLGDLEAGHQRTVPVALGVAEGAGPATLTATIHAGNPDTKTSSVFIRHADLSITPPEPLAGLAGESVRYHVPVHAFQVHNGGNTEETVLLTVDGATLEGATTLVLGPGETRTAAVTQAIPANVGDATHLPVTLTATLDDSPARTATATVQTPVQDELEPVVTWSDAPERLQEYTSTPVRLVITDDTFVDAAWVDVVPLPDQEGLDAEDAYSVSLFESNGQWVNRINARAAGLYTLTPHAVDAYGNEASGAPRVLNVTPEPEPVAPPEPEVELELQDTTAAGAVVRVTTDAQVSEVRYRIGDGAEKTATLVDGEALLELVLEPGSHELVVTVDQGGTAVARNTTVEVPEPLQGEPGLMGRLTPAPGVGLLVVALVAFVGLRRR